MQFAFQVRIVGQVALIKWNWTFSSDLWWEKRRTCSSSTGGPEGQLTPRSPNLLLSRRRERRSRPDVPVRRRGPRCSSPAYAAQTRAGRDFRGGLQGRGGGASPL